MTISGRLGPSAQPFFAVALLCFYIAGIIVITSLIPSMLDMQREGESSLPESNSNDECIKPENSLNAIALQMARFSHAAAIEKTRRVLSMSRQFHIDLRFSRDPLFSSVTQNLITMLQGYGLTQRTTNSTVDSDNETVILLENSFHSGRRHATSCKGSRCANMPRIVIQTEQERSMVACLPPSLSPGSQLHHF